MSYAVLIAAAFSISVGVDCIHYIALGLGSSNLNNFVSESCKRAREKEKKTKETSDIYTKIEDIISPKRG